MLHSLSTYAILFSPLLGLYYKLSKLYYKKVFIYILGTFVCLSHYDVNVAGYLEYA